MMARRQEPAPVRRNRFSGSSTAKAATTNRDCLVRRNRFSGSSGREEGQATVEFALVVALLLLVLFGIVDFSRLFFAYATMSNGVREGARYGIINPDDEAGIIQQAEAMMVLIGGQADVAVQFPDSDGSGNPHCSHLCRVVVRATSDFDAWTPIVPNIEIVAQATMHIE
ncbi:MAG: pilus assembly protein [Anaerolineae bacterium]